VRVAAHLEVVAVVHAALLARNVVCVCELLVDGHAEHDERLHLGLLGHELEARRKDGLDLRGQHDPAVLDAALERDAEHELLTLRGRDAHRRGARVQLGAVDVDLRGNLSAQHGVERGERGGRRGGHCGGSGGEMREGACVAPLFHFTEVKYASL